MEAGTVSKPEKIFTKVFRKKDIEKILQNKIFLGEGKFGKVYKGFLHDQTPVAVKEFKEIDDQQVVQFSAELTILIQLEHPSVVRLLGQCLEGKVPILVFEFVPNGTLYDLLHGAQRHQATLHVDKRLDIATKCSEALAYIHSIAGGPIVHGDFKPLNILMDENYQPKVADFGLARITYAPEENSTVSYVRGTPGYIDPLLQLDGKPTPLNDVYSFGVVLLELFTRKKAIDSKRNNLAETFRKSFARGMALQMFDAEIIQEGEKEASAIPSDNVVLLKNISKLAIECVSLNIEDRPNMSEVVTRLQLSKQRLLEEQDNKIERFAHEGNIIAMLEAIGSRIFTLAEVELMTNNFSVVHSKGRLGDVYKGTLDDGSSVAVRRSAIINNDVQSLFMNEVKFLCHTRHQNVIRLFGCCVHEYDIMLVFEFMFNGSLHDVLHQNSLPFPLSLERRLDIAFKVASAVAYVNGSRDKPVIHGGLTSSSILLDKQFEALISGFQFSRILDNGGSMYMDLVIGFVGYADPVYLESGKLTVKSDVYSFGVILLELITRMKATDGKGTHLSQTFLKAANSKNLFGRKKSVKLLFDKKITLSVTDIAIVFDISKLAARCLSKSMHDRPKMQEVAGHLEAILKRKMKSSRASRAADIVGESSTVAEVEIDLIAEKFSRTEIKQMTDNFSSLVSGSTFGRIYKGKLPNGAVVAVLKVPDVGEESKTRRAVMNEIRILSQINHRNVARLVGYSAEDYFMAIVYDFDPKWNLDSVIVEVDKLSGKRMQVSLDARLRIAAGIADALVHIHSFHAGAIVHGNLNPFNVVLDNNLLPKIYDFGFFRSDLEEDESVTTQVIGTAGYLDPQYLFTGVLDSKSDVYSLGVLLLILISHRPVISSKVHIVQSFREAQRKRTTMSLIDEQIATGKDTTVIEKILLLALQCTSLESIDRPNSSEVARRLHVLDSAS